MQHTVQNEAANKDNIRVMVRSVYDLQKLRIAMGNRITINFKRKLGLSEEGLSESKLASQNKKMLDDLRKSYTRITDAVVAKGYKKEEQQVSIKLPTPAKFVGDELITTFTELTLVHQYMTILRDEEMQFVLLGKALQEFSIYTEFLQNIDGIGPAMAGVLISEIDIDKSEYPSSLWAYAGLDVVSTVRYFNSTGEEKSLSKLDHDKWIKSGKDENFLAEGKYPIHQTTAGRSRKSESLVERQYTDRDGNAATRVGITFNPFLKTKLMGVLTGSFLKAGSYTVNGAEMGTEKRLKLAQEHGYDPKIHGKKTEEICEYLRSVGFTVIRNASKYGQYYYDYMNRLANHPKHKDKNDNHKKYMAYRFMIKRFLVDYYLNARRLAGLPVATEYSEGVLGMIHGQAGGGKPTYDNRKAA